MKPSSPLLRKPSGSTETDEQLMERFVQGDEQAFSELFTRHAPRLEGALRRIVGPAAGDVLQTTFL
ncbi:MAG TPA: hypothetical protein VFF12_17240, partial [Myxococcaceae bacterium]|nr:hypothetical protein [Myxococcaceae bacterium]